MTLTDKLEAHMGDLESKGIDIASKSNTKILQSYYMSIGMKYSTSFGQWMHGVSTGEYPAYSSVTRAIRKARENTPRWRKSTVDKEVKQVKEEVGYE